MTEQKNRKSTNKFKRKPRKEQKENTEIIKEREKKR